MKQIKWWVIIFTGILLTACNKGFDRLLKDREYEDTTGVTGKTPKILFLVVDGARGEAVRQAQAPHFLEMAEHAIYSWNSISDTLYQDATAWADLLTGVRKEKHGVVKSDFSNNRLGQYPVFFKYIKARMPAFRVAAYSSTDTLGKMLITDTDVNSTFGGNDDATLQAILDELKIDTVGLVFGQFGQVAAAGKEYGYDASVPEYKAAILRVDDYIGRILTALRQRNNFQQEDWLVVVTSGNGGPYTLNPSDDDGTILSNTKVNTFTVFYSPRYAPNYIDRPYTGNRYSGKSVRLYGATAATAVYAIVEEGRSDFSLGKSNQITIALKIKKNRNSYGDYSYTYPSVLGNNMSLDWWKNTGWNISLETNAWGVHYGQTGAGFNMATGANISDGKWHDLAAVFVNRDDKRYIRLFTDGNFNTEQEITSYGNFDTDAPFTLGYMPGNVTDNNRWLNAYITEVRFWKAALPDSVIKKYVCLEELPSSHPYKDYLIGYWPCKDGFGGVFKDQTEYKHDFQVKGNYQWEDFSDLMCPNTASNLTQLVPQPVDVARQIMNWLQIAVDTKWQLDGRVWVTSYVSVSK
jgi:hypothetical protein